jgi:hypothetical protein
MCDGASNPIRTLLLLLTANWFLPGGSCTALRHNTKNNINLKQDTAPKTTHAI